MLPLHAVPSWCTLYVSTSAFLDVFSLGDLLLASVSGSGSALEIRGSGAQSLLCRGGGDAPQLGGCWAGTSGHTSQQDEEESSE